MLSGYKIAVVGDLACGKSAMVGRYDTGEYRVYNQGTLGMDLKVIKVNGKNVHVFDISGLERFHGMVAQYVEDAQAIIIGIDVHESCYVEQIDKWFEFAKKNAPTAAIVVVGMKIDDTESRSYSAEIRDMVQAKMKEKPTQKIAYVECSAKSGDGVNEVFQQAMKFITQMQAERPTVVTREPTSTSPLLGESDDGGCCCGCRCM